MYKLLTTHFSPNSFPAGLARSSYRYGWKYLVLKIQLLKDSYTTKINISIVNMAIGQVKNNRQIK